LWQVPPIKGLVESNLLEVSRCPFCSSDAVGRLQQPRLPPQLTAWALERATKADVDVTVKMASCVNDLVRSSLKSLLKALAEEERRRDKHIEAQKRAFWAEAEQRGLHYPKVGLARTRGRRKGAS
jgi:hypothetical protein